MERRNLSGAFVVVTGLGSIFDEKLSSQKIGSLSESNDMDPLYLTEGIEVNNLLAVGLCRSSGEALLIVICSGFKFEICNCF